MDFFGYIHVPENDVVFLLGFADILDSIGNDLLHPSHSPQRARQAEELTANLDLLEGLLNLLDFQRWCQIQLNVNQFAIAPNQQSYKYMCSFFCY